MIYRRFFSLIAVSFLLYPPLFSQQQFDTLSIEDISRGIRYFHLQTSRPQQIHVAEIQLRNPSLRIESLRHQGLEKTSDVVVKRSSGKQRSVVAINGDFFDTADSLPVNNQITNAIPVTGYTTPEKSQFAVTAHHEILMEGFSFSGTIRTKTKVDYTFSRLNSKRILSEITFYTGYQGRTTKRKPGGVEIQLRPVDTKFRIGDTMRYVVTAISSEGYCVIPEHGAVISFGRSDSSAKFRSAFSNGDTVSLFLNYTPGKRKSDTIITQLIGGWGRILHLGKYSAEYNIKTEGLKEKFLNTRHPRTFAGINSDTTTLYICVVDGRQSNSIGMTFTEMAEVLRLFHVTEAVNFDGGGSSTLVIRGKVVNSPSDPSGERAVANSLHVITSGQ